MLSRLQAALQVCGSRRLWHLLVWQHRLALVGNAAVFSAGNLAGLQPLGGVLHDGVAVQHRTIVWRDAVKLRVSWQAASSKLSFNLAKFPKVLAHGHANFIAGRSHVRVSKEAVTH